MVKEFYVKSAIKLVLILSLFVVGLYFFVQQYEPPNRKVENLPWMIEIKSVDDTQVFGVHIGKHKLSVMGSVLGKLPELAIFQDETGQRVLEAYFSRLKIAGLQANVVAVLDADQERLATFTESDKTGKPMPSGLRKYDLSLAGLKQVGEMTAWKLVYMPVADYSEQQLLSFFGQPQQKTALSAQHSYWHYPDKALLIVYDAEGKEIFHYTTKNNYQRLLTELLAIKNAKNAQQEK